MIMYLSKRKETEIHKYNYIGNMSNKDSQTKKSLPRLYNKQLNQHSKCFLKHIMKTDLILQDMIIIDKKEHLSNTSSVIH